MLRMVWAQAQMRSGRTCALLLGVLVATTGFLVLTGASDRSQLVVTETVRANARAAYDVLVRPRGARNAQETERGSVRPNHLSGQYGGITPAQWRAVQQIGNVEVAAPIAMVGYAAALATVRVDLTDAVDPHLDRQVIRLRPTWTADAGLTSATEATPRFVYITRRPVAPTSSGEHPDTGEDFYALPDGSERPLRELSSIRCTDRDVPYLYLEQAEDGSWAPICGTWYLDWSGGGATASLSRSQFFVLQALPDGSYLDFSRVNESLAGLGVARSVDKPRRVARPEFQFDWPLWLSVAAIDPGQEARLVGLDRAVTSGGYLPQASAQPGQEPKTVPALVPARSPIAERLSMAVERIATPVQVPGVPPAQLLANLAVAPGVARGAPIFDAADVYAGVLSDPAALVRLDVTLQAAPPAYTSTGGGALRPKPVPVDPNAWRTEVSQFGEQGTGTDAMQPYLAADIGFRALTPSAVRPPTDVLNPPRINRIGVFDPDRLTEFPGLAVVPQETYQVPPVTGADGRSRSLLGNGSLQPGNNPAGYLAAPSSLLIPLDVAEQLLSRPDPISAVRVRVAGVTGVDPVSRERVRLVAEEIAGRTGLDIDVTVGSSPQPQTIELPAGTFGRPALALHEGWSKKGVAVAIVRAADRKSLALFGLILVVCLLFLATALSAAVRDRHRDLAVLACLGWPAWRRATLILTEVGLIGLAAGGLSAGLSHLLTSAVGFDLSWRQASLAIPAALAVTLAAAAVPALRAGQAHPAAALHPLVAPARRTAHLRGIAGLAATNLTRTPGRTLAGAVSLAVGVAGIVMLLAIVWAFDGAVVGTLLGDAVSLRARPVDVVAVACTMVLGGFAVADVLYLNIRERANEFAVLAASGWTAGAAGRLVVYEAAGIGLLGGVLGGGLGLAGIAALAGDLPARLAQVTLLAGVIALVVAVIAGVVPALSLRRLTMTTLLAEE